MIEDHDEISFFLSFRNVAVPSLAVPGLGARIQFKRMACIGGDY